MAICIVDPGRTVERVTFVLTGHRRETGSIRWTLTLVNINNLRFLAKLEDWCHYITMHRGSVNS